MTRLRARVGLALGLGAALSSPAPPASAAGKRATCELAVGNKTAFRVMVHVDGVYWGWVSPGRSFTFKGIPEGRIVVYGTTLYAEAFWGPQPMKCKGTAAWELAS